MPGMEYFKSCKVIAISPMDVLKCAFCLPKDIFNAKLYY